MMRIKFLKENDAGDKISRTVFKLDNGEEAQLIVNEKYYYYAVVNASTGKEIARGPERVGKKNLNLLKKKARETLMGLGVELVTEERAERLKKSL